MAEDKKNEYYSTEHLFGRAALSARGAVRTRSGQLHHRERFRRDAGRLVQDVHQLGGQLRLSDTVLLAVQLLHRDERRKSCECGSGRGVPA